MTTRVLIRNAGAGGPESPRTIVVKESQAGGPEIVRLAPGEEQEFQVHGSSSITVRED